MTKSPDMPKQAYPGLFFVIYNVLFYRQYSVVCIAKHNIRDKWFFTDILDTDSDILAVAIHGDQQVNAIAGFIRKDRAVICKEFRVKAGAP